ncbi:Z1 domain-containing protein [Arthrobacter sp. ZBG10]|uniref:Z1 domain-containing protein n=1 Tax=Arthrobacter sp. ZBG10 TaxID=1676590 RepID=UPI00067F9FD1|nr:Z1 domain-containing protein [Arthrobacter sp. ZBG10]
MNSDLKDLSESLDRVEQAIHAWNVDPLTQEPRPGITEQAIQSAVVSFGKMQVPGATDVQLEGVALRLIKSLMATIELGTIVTKEDHVPWLDEARPSIVWTRWRAYRKLLAKKKRSSDVLNKLDKFTDEVLDLAGNPLQEGSWSRRGLLIGDVQSGKTQNYLALINKAADAGYRLVVILAGNTEYLRRQTQERVDEGILGRDTQVLAFNGSTSTGIKSTIGVGLIDKKVLSTQSMTTMAMDFLQATKRGTALTVSKNSNEPFVFVVKKNKFVLEALAGWARNLDADKAKVDVPLLLLDDESDYASVNTNNEGDDPTAINKAIRSLLNRFERSSYLAITATPFANIFIDNEAEMTIQPDEGEDAETVTDLFPDDYIYGLEAPSTYVGIRRVFGTIDEPTESILRHIDDAPLWLPTNHKNGHVVTSLPSSLSTAIRSYLVANAVLDLNGSASLKRSMLVNVSRFKNVQALVGDLIATELAILKDALEVHGATYLRGIPNPVIETLHETFQDEYIGCGYTWHQIAEVLHSSVSLIRVKVYNSDPDRLGVDVEFEPDVPARQIAVGGDLLSRGLTLDNLVVSYFHRSVRAADTMMQMARWFGYRDGYDELCRLWISAETADNYRFVGDAVEELRRELKLMKTSGRTPREFGLAVRESPEALLITARNKSRSAISAAKTVDLRGQRLETTKLTDNIDQQKKNLEAVRNFSEALAADCVPLDSETYKWPRYNGVDRDHVAQLLSSFLPSAADAYFNDGVLVNMVQNSTHPNFSTWDVVFVEGERSRGAVPNLSLGAVDIVMPQRTITHRPFVSGSKSRRQGSRNTADSGEWLVSDRSSRLAGRTDLQSMIPSETLQTIVDGRANKSTAVAEDHFYEHLANPILFVYALAPQITQVQRFRTKDPETKKWTTSVQKSDPATIDGLEAIVALKIALPKPADQGNKDESGKGKYLLNKVAQRYGFLNIESWATA